MKKLIEGIKLFRQKATPRQLQQFSILALEQKPDALFIACSDSRVAPNLFASTDPGDLFVVRNVGNIVPQEAGSTSELAAIEFAVLTLKVKDIIVCGHSECGAMHALLNEDNKSNLPHLYTWLAEAHDSKEQFKKTAITFPADLSLVNRLSQVNTLQQIEHLKKYSCVQEHLKTESLALHAWWFDIATAQVYAYQEEKRAFVEMR